MTKSKFSETQILAILREGEAGVPVAQPLRRHGISQATFCNWKSKCEGMSVGELRRRRELGAGNTKLMEIYAELALENLAIRDLLS